VLFRSNQEDERQLEAFNAEVDRWAAWRDARGRRAFSIPVAACSDDPEATSLDRTTMAEWMRARGLTSPRLRWLVDYACRDDYGLTLEQTSAWAGLFYFASRMKRPGAEAQSLITWPEGNGRVVRHLLGRAAERVRLGLAVTDIRPAGSGETGGVQVVAVRHDGRTAAGFRARQVIFAAPQFLTRYVLKHYRDGACPPHVAEFEYGAWMVANLFLAERPRPGFGFPEAWDNVLYESPSLGYVTATHQRGLDRGPTVFTYYYPLTDADPREARTRLLSAGRDEWAEVALADLERAHRDVRHVTRRLDVMRYIIIPMSKSGIALGSTFVISIVMGDFFVVKVMSGGGSASVVSAFYENVGVLQYPIAAASAVLLTLVLIAMIALILRVVDIRREITQ
jgi:hypothetical protein